MYRHSVVGEAVAMLQQRLKRSEPVYRCFGAVKGAMQDRRAARTAARYQAEAMRAGTTIPDPSSISTALAARLTERGVVSRRVRKGELHVFLAYAHTNWEAVLPLVLRRYGRLTTFEWRARGYDERRPGWVARRDAMNREMLETFEAAHREAPIDVVVGYLSGRNTATGTVEAMARSGAVIVNFSWDDKLNFPGPMLGGRYTSPAEVAAAVDLNLTDDPRSILRYAVHGGLAMFWPPAAEPTIHHPRDDAFEFDVSFLGQRYGSRPVVIGALRRQGIDVRTFGRGWDGGDVSSATMVTVYGRSRINLGFAGVQYCHRLKSLKGRDFEVPMSGGLYLTEEHDLLHRVYEVGREIVTYRDAADCAARIRWLLEHPEEAARIRAAGRARALRDHTWETRFDHVFRLAGLLA